MTKRENLLNFLGRVYDNNKPAYRHIMDLIEKSSERARFRSSKTSSILGRPTVRPHKKKVQNGL